MEKAQLDAMKALGMTDEEIADIASSDKAIDHGEKLYELSDDLKVGAKKARQAERKAVTSSVKRERKADQDKRDLLQAIDDALCDLSDNVTVTNPERELIVMYHDRKFKVVLSAPRT